MEECQEEKKKKDISCENVVAGSRKLSSYPAVGVKVSANMATETEKRKQSYGNLIETFDKLGSCFPVGIKGNLNTSVC